MKHTLKQLGGAFIGMAIAALIYVVVGWGSLQNIKGYLVEGLDTGNTARVRVNDKNIDDEKLALIARRAREVTAMASSTSSVPEAVVRAEYRREQRVAVSVSEHGSAPEPTAEKTATPYARRQARIDQRFAQMSAREAEPVVTNREEPSMMQTETTIVPAGKHLSSSGAEVWLLGAAAMIGALLAMRSRERLLHKL